MVICCHAPDAVHCLSWRTGYPVWYLLHGHIRGQHWIMTLPSWNFLWRMPLKIVAFTYWFDFITMYFCQLSLYIVRISKFFEAFLNSPFSCLISSVPVYSVKNYMEQVGIFGPHIIIGCFQIKVGPKMTGYSLTFFYQNNLCSPSYSILVN